MPPPMSAPMAAIPAQGLPRRVLQEPRATQVEGAWPEWRPSRPTVNQHGQVRLFRSLVDGIEAAAVQQKVVRSLGRKVDAHKVIILLGPPPNLRCGRSCVREIRHQRPFEPLRGLGTEVANPTVIRHVHRILEPHVVEGAIARNMGGIEHTHVHVGSVHVLQSRLHVPIYLGTDMWQIPSVWPAEVGPPAGSRLQDEFPGRKPEGVRLPQSVIRNDRRKNGMTAGRQGPLSALTDILLDGQFEPFEVRLIRRVHIPVVHLVGTLHNMGVHVYNFPAIPGHDATPSNISNMLLVGGPTAPNAASLWTPRQRCQRRTA